MINLGDIMISEINLGGAQVAEAYLGRELVFSTALDLNSYFTSDSPSTGDTRTYSRVPDDKLVEGEKIAFDNYSDIGYGPYGFRWYYHRLQYVSGEWRYLNVGEQLGRSSLASARDSYVANPDVLAVIGSIRCPMKTTPFTVSAGQTFTRVDL